MMNLVRLLCCFRIPAKSNAFKYEPLESYEVKRPSAPPAASSREAPSPPIPTVRETVFASPLVEVRVMASGDDAKSKEKEDARKYVRGEPVREKAKVPAPLVDKEVVPFEGGTATLPWSRFEREGTTIQGGVSKFQSFPWPGVS